MTQIPYLEAATVEPYLNWLDLTQALRAGHQRPRAEIDDILFKQGDNALLNRAAWITGAGIGIKTATIFPGNSLRQPPLPNVNALFTLFDEETGVPSAIIDGRLVTKWKTAGDSILGAQLLARPDSKVLSIIGAGDVASALVDAYRAAFPGLERIQIWNRSPGKAEALAAEKGLTVLPSLEEAARSADIISTATMTAQPILQGAWLQPGCHVDLIGAYRPDMREADDALISQNRLFVDARETTLHDIGEIAIPLAAGVITEDSILGDLYDLCNGAPARQSAAEITVYKNGGGAHLDLMTALYIKEVAATNSA